MCSSDLTTARHSTSSVPSAITAIAVFFIYHLFYISSREQLLPRLPKHGELNPRAMLIFRLFVFALMLRDALLLDARHRQAADSDRRGSRAVIRELAVVAHGDDIGEIGYYIARDRD